MLRGLSVPYHSGMAPRLRNRDGRAVVTLKDSESGRRREYRLGEYGSTEAEQRYHALMAKFTANGRRLEPDTRTDGTTAVAHLVSAYWAYAKQRYSGGHVDNIKAAMRLLNRHFGEKPLGEFGPNALRELRGIMVAGGHDHKPWSRQYVNAQTGKVREAFSWGVAHEMVDASQLVALRAVKPLRKGEGVRESEPVQPAVLEHVLAALPYMNRQIRTAVELQMLTASRPGEILRIRPMDIVKHSDELWVFDPKEHKNEWRGKMRLIPLGPRAIEAIRPFVDRKPPRPCLSPREALLESQGRVRRGDPRKKQKRTGKYYTSGSMRNAVYTACDKAGVPKWSPYQLRHWAISEIEYATDEQSASIVAGHSSSRVTRDVYIHRAARSLAPIIERCDFMRGERPRSEHGE